MTEHERNTERAETIARMLGRYSTPAVAAEMANAHAMDHPAGHPFRVFWQDVSRAIRQEYEL